MWFVSFTTHELLEAAHITPDSEPEGEPLVSNGLALCKLHHAAFDKNILGISPDYVVEIRLDILEEHDGPMLKHGLQEMHGARVYVPRRVHSLVRCDCTVKYILALEIAVPRDKLVTLYADPTNWSKWQDSLVSYEILNGNDRETGSKTKLINRFGKKNIEIIETVEANELPDLFTCIYEAPGTWNRVENRFISIDNDATRWEFRTEFKCGGILRLMSLVIPGMFRKASLKEMKAFKGFAECIEDHA